MIMSRLMNKNTYIIGDVHGCFYTLQNLINKLPKYADIIFVGDLACSHPSSVRTHTSTLIVK